MDSLSYHTTRLSLTWTIDIQKIDQINAAL